NSPFNLLKHKFNIWIAFDPSPEDGVTVGYPVDRSSGTPIEPKETKDPNKINTDPRLLQTRDSKFGFMYGSRYGDRDSTTPLLTQVAPSNPLADPKEWFLPREVLRGLVPDRRRMHKNWDYRKFFDSYLDSLDTSISKVWKSR